MAETIRFEATVFKLQTMAEDYGIRLTLDLPEDAIPQMAMLAEAKRQGIALTFEAKSSEPQQRTKGVDDRPKPRRKG
jgi:hypothetical protein